MDLQSYRVTFFVAVFLLALLVASPALSRMLVYPRTEFFTELWLLDQNHRAETYPFNILRNQNYSVYLGIRNQLGYCAYYLVEVKFRNQTQPAPMSFGPLPDRTPSSLPSLYNITAFVADEGVWEQPLTFSFDYIHNETSSRIELNDMVLNGVVLNLRGISSSWNSTLNRFYGDIVFELWLFDASVNSFQYHARFVDLKLNMTTVQ